MIQIQPKNKKPKKLTVADIIEVISLYETYNDMRLKTPEGKDMAVLYYNQLDSRKQKILQKYLDKKAHFLAEIASMYLYKKPQAKC